MRKKKVKQSLKTAINVLDKFGNIASIPVSLKIIFGIIASVFGIAGLWFLHISHKLWDLLNQLCHSSIWLTPINLKLWQILILLFLLVALIILFYKLLKKSINKRYIPLNNINLEQIENYKFYWYKDINSNNIIIDKIPYCAFHNKKLVETQYHNYTCPHNNCDNGIVYTHINRLIKNISKDILKNIKN